MSDRINLASICVVSFGAYLMPHISRRLMMPAAVGELFYGMLVGSLILKSGSTPEVIRFLSEIGFLLLMYIAGLELDIDRITSLNKKELLAYFGYVFLLVISSVLAVHLLSLPPFFVIVLITSAIGLLYAVLKELDIVKSDIGQTLILVGVLGEVATLMGMTALSILQKIGSGSKVAVFHQIGWIVLFLFALYIVLKVLRLLLWWFPGAKRFFMSVGSPSKIGIRANIFNMLLFSVFALFADLEPILGAFLGGLIFSKLFAEREEMLEILGSFGYGFLIPIFFIEVGTRFRFDEFARWHIIKAAITLSLLLLLIRAIATLPLLSLNIKKRELLYVPFAQAFPLTLLVAGAAIGEYGGMITKEQSLIIILTAVITAIVYPWAMKILYKYIPITTK